MKKDERKTRIKYTILRVAHRKESSPTDKEPGPV
jgi:hypothetical protein